MRFSINSAKFLHAARSMPGALVLAVGLFVYFTYHVTRFHLAQMWPVMPTGDASILFDSAREVFARADYPARMLADNMTSVFPYPPSAVLLFRGLGIGGPQTFMIS